MWVRYSCSVIKLDDAWAKNMVCKSTTILYAMRCTHKHTHTHTHTGLQRGKTRNAPKWFVSWLPLRGYSCHVTSNPQSILYIHYMTAVVMLVTPIMWWLSRWVYHTFFLEGLNDYLIIKEYLNTNLDIWTFVLKEDTSSYSIYINMILYTGSYII